MVGRREFLRSGKGTLFIGSPVMWMAGFSDRMMKKRGGEPMEQDRYNRRLAPRLCLLACAIPFALRTDVISQHRPQDEVFFGCQLVQRTRYHVPDSPDAFRTSEEQVDAVLGDRLYHEGDVLALQAGYGKCLVFAVDRIEHHAAHSFLVFVHMV